MTEIIHLDRSEDLLPANPQFLASLHTYQWHTKRRVSFRLARHNPPKDYRIEAQYWASFFEHPHFRLYAIYPARRWILVSFELPFGYHDLRVSNEIVTVKALEACTPLIYPARIFRP